MLKLYNSLSRKIEEFKPISPPKVTLYTCGPTVYDYITIGNMRTYVLSDVLRRVLKFNGYEVNSVMNITDVGHLTGDNLGDSSQGEDRLEKGAKRERKSAWEIARFYEKAFRDDISKLNISADIFPRATDHIKEQIEIIKDLEKKGYTYRISDGIYFETGKFADYGKLSSLDEKKKGARIEPNPEKKNIADFALWKFSPKKGKRQMEWNSPWGAGFPGWHIECSAMSMKYLSKTFNGQFKPHNFQTIDLHIGGEDLKSTHHPNEIAQSEAATGKKFVNYWLHGAFILVNGGRMGKSLGNAYTMKDIEAKGFDALDLRYFFLNANYRKQINFTFDGLCAARNARQTLLNIFSQKTHNWENSGKRTVLSAEKLAKVQSFKEMFLNAVNMDLNLPQALSVLWSAVKSSVPLIDKYELVLEFDEILGLNIRKSQSLKKEAEIPSEILSVARKRNLLRAREKWSEADKVRIDIERKGFLLLDTPTGTEVVRKK